MSIPQQVTQAVLDYMKQETQVILPAHEHNPELSKGKVFASNLGLCPRKPAFEANKAEQTHPPTSEQELKSLLRMNAGRRMGELIQEAVTWAFADETQYEVISEFSSEKDDVRGRIDIALLNKIPFGTLIEIKWTRNKYFAPKLYHIYQMMWYIENADSALGLKESSRHYLLGIDDNLNWYELLYIGMGDYRLYKNDEEYKADWNTPDILNKRELERLTQWHKDYLSGKIDTTPFPDLLNDDRAWQCFQWEKAPTLTTMGILKPSCPYFGHCHKINTDLVHKVKGGFLYFDGEGETL